MSAESQGPSPDTLIVTVVKAEGLLAKDKGGTSDPFAEVGGSPASECPRSSPLFARPPALP